MHQHGSTRLRYNRTMKKVRSMKLRKKKRKKRPTTTLTNNDERCRCEPLLVLLRKCNLAGSPCIYTCRGHTRVHACPHMEAEWHGTCTRRDLDRSNSPLIGRHFRRTAFYAPGLSQRAYIPRNGHKLRRLPQPLSYSSQPVDSAR